MKRKRKRIAFDGLHALTCQMLFFTLVGEKQTEGRNPTVNLGCESILTKENTLVKIAMGHKESM